ncbi:MAG TPA: type IV pilus secretin PilQ [Gammaproteobacteria bacterium]|nr:MAG: pilus assembly protein PilQ [Candidatus Thioglobus sp. MED-G23]HBP83994.1 type IV pilus secretin PilQ [Gammaproteobacteria bacterium]|tara:strand:+ start:2824 stop:4995 length:2172 start_codon:yes stop_codon:yes gene_type:complete
MRSLFRPNYLRKKSILWAFAALLGPIATPVLADAEPTITRIDHTSLSGGRLQIDIYSSAALPAPRVFRTSAPDRIVLDFFGVRSQLKSSMIDVGRGAIENILIAQDQERSRMVINLISAVGFVSEAADNRLTLVVDPVISVSGDGAGTGTAGGQMGQTGQDSTRIGLIDFRRTPEGAGRVILEFDSEQALVDVHQHLGEIVLDISGGLLDDALVRRLDVIDFATPVQFIDAFATDSGARVVVMPRGEFEFASLQSGKRFTLDVSLKPVAGEGDQAITYSGKTISFDFQNIPVRSALQQIANETSLNFVISDSVTGDMSLRLKDVPWDQALDTIMQTKGLARRQQGNVVWIAPAEEITNQERLVLEASRQVSELEPLVSDLIQINYAKAEDIANLLKSVRAIEPSVQQSMFGSVSVAEVQTEENRLLSDRGSVTVDERTNSLLIQDTAQKIREIRELISELDRPVKQVLIETRIVEANEDFSRNIGVKLGLTGINSNTDLGSMIGSGSLANTATVRNDGISSSGDGSLGVNLPAQGIGSVSPASYAFTLAKAGAGWASLIDLEISALEAEGNGKIVANPRLLTADKQEAHIEQGQERIFTTNTLGEGTVVTKKAVLGLTVTPQITPDDRVILDVFVTKDSFVSPTEENINTLQVRTQVLLDNGETIVLGGIYTQQTSESVSKVPVLGDLPVLGPLFRTKGILDNRRELLIFLTPRIINPVLTAG